MNKFDIQDTLSNISINMEKARITLRNTIEGYGLCDKPDEVGKLVIAENIKALYVMLEVVDDYCRNAEVLVDNLNKRLSITD